MKLHPRPWPEKTIREYQRFFANTIDKWLDAGYGSQLLKRNDFRSIVKKCLMRFEGDRLRIHTAVIMPTHVHTLLEPFDAQKLPMIMKGIKGASARGANQILGRNSAFWAEESYDHIVRSQSEYDHYCRYVTENPIKSRLRQDEFWLMPKRNDIRFSERNL